MYCLDIESLWKWILVILRHVDQNVWSLTLINQSINQSMFLFQATRPIWNIIGQKSRFYRCEYFLLNCLWHTSVTVVSYSPWQSFFWRSCVDAIVLVCMGSASPPKLILMASLAGVSALYSLHQLTNIWCMFCLWQATRNISQGSAWSFQLPSSDSE